MNISQLVTKTIEAGVTPIELTYKAVRDCYTKQPIAYRGEIFVNSIEFGLLQQHDFSKISDTDDVGIRVSEWGVREALHDMKLFKESGRKTRWISVPCPVAFAERPEMYDRLKAFLQSAKGRGDTKLCLEFSDRILLSKADVRTAILDLKLLGIKSMIVCDDAETCPFFKLVDIPVDIVLFTPRMTKMIDDRNKPEVIESLVKYLQSMYANVVAAGADSSDRIRLFNRLEIEGYIPTDGDYMTAEVAVLQKEADE